MINQISRELRSRMKRPEDVIEPYRRQAGGGLGMLPKDFARALRAEVPNLKA